MQDCEEMKAKTERLAKILRGEIDVPEPPGGAFAYTPDEPAPNIYDRYQRVCAENTALRDEVKALRERLENQARWLGYTPQAAARRAMELEAERECLVDEVKTLRVDAERVRAFETCNGVTLTEIEAPGMSWTHDNAIQRLREQRDTLTRRVAEVETERDELKEHMVKHFPGRGSDIADLTCSDEIIADLAELSSPTEKLKLDTSDPHTSAVWEAVLAAKKEVASWPAWKSGAATVTRDLRAELAQALATCKRLRALVKEACGIGRLLVDAAERENDMSDEEVNGWRARGEARLAEIEKESSNA
jgi:cell division septum initiation protein DivIVA